MSSASCAARSATVPRRRLHRRSTSSAPPGFPCWSRRAITWSRPSGCATSSPRRWERGGWSRAEPDTSSRPRRASSRPSRASCGVAFGDEREEQLDEIAEERVGKGLGVGELGQREPDAELTQDRRQRARSERQLDAAAVGRLAEDARERVAAGAGAVGQLLAQLRAAPHVDEELKAEGHEARDGAE